jgi:hypothetical protein
VLAGADTAKLSVGTHTLKIDWLGDSGYGPSQNSVQFIVTSSPTPSSNRYTGEVIASKVSETQGVSHSWPLHRCKINQAGKRSLFP